MFIASKHHLGAVHHLEQRTIWKFSLKLWSGTAEEIALGYNEINEKLLILLSIKDQSIQADELPNMTTTQLFS